MWPFPDPEIAEREFKRIVIRVPHPLGDQIMATAAVRALRKRYPAAHIALHGSEVAEHLYRGSRFFDEFIVSDKHEAFREQRKKLRAGRFDAAILLSGSFRSAVAPFLARIPHRIGYRRSGRTPLLTEHWQRPQPGPGGTKAPYPTKQFYFDLVERLGATDRGPVELAVNAKDDEYIDAWMERLAIAKDESILALCVGAAFGPSKLWPAEYFATVADHMAEKHGARVIVLCSPNEREIGARVSAAAKRPLIDTGEAPLHVGGVKSLIARASVLLTNDTGPRQIAAALGTPSVCLIGPMPSTYTDTDLDTQVVLREPVACHPCEKKICRVEGHPCLTNLLPSRAIDAIESVWEAR